MLQRFTHRNLTWIDLENPSQKEIQSVISEFNIHPFIIDEILTPSIRPKAELNGNCVYLIMHFPTRSEDHLKLIEKEVDFLIGQNFIITAHYESFDPLYEFQKLFQVHSILMRQNLGDHAGHIFYTMLKVIYNELELNLDYINADLKRIEHNIFDGKESTMVREISETHRRILDIKQTIRFHEEVLKTYTTISESFFVKNNSCFLADNTLGEYYKIANILQGHKEILKDLRETNDSLLTTKNNDLIRKLTIMSFITFPLTVITGIFGMNASLPLVESSHGFWIIILIMFLASSIMLGFFYIKKWF